MTSGAVIVRADVHAVDELLEMRDAYRVEIGIIGLAEVAHICFVAHEISAEALALAEQLDRDPLAILDYADVAPFADAYPALAAWRALVLAKPANRRDRLEAAAAYESQAVEAERVGAPDVAALAMQAAYAAVRSGRRSA